MNLKNKYLEKIAEEVESAKETRLKNRMRNLVKAGVVEIGEQSYGIPNFIIDKHSASKIFIGKFCSIAEEVKIFNGSNHNTKWVSTFPGSLYQRSNERLCSDSIGSSR
mgnify:CR=1 FL=1